MSSISILNSVFYLWEHIHNVKYFKLTITGHVLHYCNGTRLWSSCLNVTFFKHRKAKSLLKIHWLVGLEKLLASSRTMCIQARDIVNMITGQQIKNKTHPKPADALMVCSCTSVKYSHSYTTVSSQKYGKLDT
jgi:hypothetical protein